MEGGAVARRATVASDDDTEQCGTVRCTTLTHDDDIGEAVAAGFTTGAGTDDCDVGEVTTVCGGT